jgi:hypothetical protein
MTGRHYARPLPTMQINMVVIDPEETSASRRANYQKVSTTSAG